MAFPEIFNKDFNIADEANAFVFGDDGGLFIESDNSNRIADDMLV